MISPETQSGARAAMVLARVLDAVAEVRWAYLFGSAARGERFADLDVGVMLDPRARGVQVLGGLALGLEAAVEGVPVDLIDLGAATPALAGSIVREGRLLIDRDPAARVSWEIEANRTALDIEPWHREFERLRRAALLERVR